MFWSMYCLGLSYAFNEGYIPDGGGAEGYWLEYETWGCPPPIGYPGWLLKWGCPSGNGGGWSEAFMRGCVDWQSAP